MKYTFKTLSDNFNNWGPKVQVAMWLLGIRYVPEGTNVKFACSSSEVIPWK